MNQELGDMERRFAALIWEREPVASGELVSLCENEFGWKKSTTYTMLKRLCERGLFRNDSGTVRALVSFGEYEAERSRRVLERDFGGSLPRFIAAFSGGAPLADEELLELQAMIDRQRGRGL